MCERFVNLLIGENGSLIPGFMILTGVVVAWNRDLVVFVRRAVRKVRRAVHMYTYLPKRPVASALLGVGGSCGMVGGYNKGGYLGRHEEAQKLWSSAAAIAAADTRGEARSWLPTGSRARPVQEEAGSTCRLPSSLSRQFLPKRPVASALLSLARVSFSGEPCRKAFLLPNMGNNHGGCSRAGLLWVFGWKPGLEGVDSWGRARGVLVSCGACHAFLAAVRTMHGRGSVPVPSLFSLAHTGMLLHNEVCLVFFDRGTCTLLRP